MRVSDDNLQTENSLLAQQLKALPEGFEPPCLKCLKRSNTETNAESSDTTERNASTTNVVTNPSLEETTIIPDENSRLKNLLQTRMFKSLKGHQTLCNVLKKSILHKNPRKEGLGFERKLNDNGSYWTPEQYPQTVWVPAKSKTLDPSLLSGYDCPIPVYDDESLDSNYKLFKNQCGEAFARFIGPNCRNGPPSKKIWVPKSIIEALPVTVLQTMQEEDARYILKMARQNEYMHTSSNCYAHVSGKNFNPFSFDYSNSFPRNNSYGYRKKSYPARAKVNVSQPPAKMWVVKKA